MNNKKVLTKNTKMVDISSVYPAALINYDNDNVDQRIAEYISQRIKYYEK